MTTKPLVGSQAQRQSQQRSLNHNVISRPSLHRGLSSTSPTRRSHEEGIIDLTLDSPDPTPSRYGTGSEIGGSRLIDLTLDVPDPTPSRYGTSPRIGGSRPKQELSNSSTSSSQLKPSAGSRLKRELSNDSTHSSQLKPSAGSRLKRELSNDSTHSSQLEASASSPLKQELSNDSTRSSQLEASAGSCLKQELSNDSTRSSQLEASAGSLNLVSNKPPVPVRGRPQLHSDVPFSRSSSIGITLDQINNFASAKPMPLPARPEQHVPPILERANGTTINPNKKDVRPKPYVLEVPTAAPTYTPDGHADFFPWHGHGSHPEDQFSESVIRGGFFDKTQMTQNETGSAKTSIYPSLKHKSGLQTLSSLFTSVLAQRRAHGNITANSTFKPPPRVTVTDTKREIWLKDLANPTISLRRLSRSIPHGIRGKVLLEHSLNKNIPIERAIWLAKCVGANELRSFRRKGAGGAFTMGNEAKWVRDFTVCVEQVLEGIIGSCGDKDFRRKINYAIRLAAHFHAECLLDREHYMDWILSSLESTSQSKLPIWLLIAQMHRKDILKYRRHGRRLAAALMTRFSEIAEHPDRDILSPLVDRIRLLLQDLLVSSPDNFIWPETWSKYGKVLYNNLACYENPLLLAAWTKIDNRNVRLTADCRKTHSSLQRRVYQTLDKLLSTMWTDEMIDICWQLDDDKAELIHAVLEWSTSCYRPGNAKVFIGARIIRSWNKHGVDATAAILLFLDSDTCEIGRNKPAVYHLVSELARANDFYVPKYFQWLIGRGGIRDPSDLAPTGPCATRLLAELPTHDTSDKMITLHRILLRRGEYPFNAEEEKMMNCINTIAAHLTFTPITSEQDMQSIPCEYDTPKLFLLDLSRANKSELGFWLRRRASHQILEPMVQSLDDWNVTPMAGGASSFTTAQFSFVRECLESIEDFSNLADVIKSATDSNNPQVLASCADTLNLHIDVFAAIGALHGLFDVLVGRLRSLADDLDTIPRVLLASLADLSSRIPEHHIISSQLARQLALSDRKYAADACSPVSDHMAGVLHNGEAEFIDEIEKVLANGTSMDQGTMERLFQRVTQHFANSWEKSGEQQRKCVQLLTALRDFNPRSFDLLMIVWVSNVQELESRPSMLRIYAPLVGLGCLSLKDLTTACLKSTHSESASNQKVVTRVSMELLALLLKPLDLPGVLTSDETYHARLLQAHMQRDSCILTLSVIRKAFEACSRPADEDLTLLLSTTLDIFRTNATHELLQTLILSSFDLTSKSLVFPLVYGNMPKARVLVNTAINKLLDPGNSSEALDIPIELTLRLANDISLPFCQMKVASAFGSGNSTKTAHQSLHPTQPEELSRAIESVIATGGQTWTCIIPSLDTSILQHLRRAAETHLIAIFQSIKALSFNQLMLEDTQLARAESLLLIFDLTIATLASEGVSPNCSSHNCFPDLVAQLNSVWQLIANAHNGPCKAIFVIKWLPVLLSFTGTQNAMLNNSKSSHEHRGRTILVLTAILLELHALRPSVDTETHSIPIEQCFDLILRLVDVLPDEIRQQCIRSLRDVSSNSVVAYIYSIMATPSDWLYINMNQGERDARTPSAAMGKAASPNISTDINTNLTSDSNGNQEASTTATTTIPQLLPFVLKRWEMLGEPTPNIGENDTSLSLTLFASRKTGS